MICLVEGLRIVPRGEKNLHVQACCPDFSFGYLRSHGPLPFCQGPLPSLSGPAASTPSPLASWSEKGLVRIVQRMVAVTVGAANVLRQPQRFDRHIAVG